MQNFDALRVSGGATAWESIAEAGEVPLLLVRHGRTALNAQRRFLGRLDVPLDEIGQIEARSVGERLAGLPRAGLYSSPLLRALQTARTLGEPTQVPALAELFQGELEGLDGPTARARFPDFFAAWLQDPASVRVPGGEHLLECQARGLAALAEIGARHVPGPPVIVVTHQMVLVSAILHALGQPLGRFREVQLGNCSLTLVASSAAGLRVVCLDDRAHISLPPSEAL